MQKETGRIFSFYFFLRKKSPRTKVFYLLSWASVVLALIIRAYRLAGNWTETSQVVFQNILMTFFLQFLIIILALFYGSSIVSEELEGKTWPYLSSRPVSQAAIIVGKYLAYLSLTSIMLVSAVVISYLILNLDQDFHLADLGTVVRYSAVLFLGLAAYLSFFTFLGTWLKKPILVGLAFGFGWESIIQYFPGSTQKLSIAHYLKSILPQYTTASGKLGFLFIRLEPTKPLIAILMLLLIVIVFLALAALIFSYKEYLFED
ncbi:MAG TPA: ABC transporter permease [Candidatus Aminicenantes bacterium]|nr:MAG: ABC transporter permease [Candidatus Aminicenantes bacterium]HEK85957.1 ABC transporter permease [Candidatus Aminicenantes bacterium]